MNTPRLKAVASSYGLKPDLVRHSADSGYIEIIVWKPLARDNRGDNLEGFQEADVELSSKNAQYLS